MATMRTPLLSLLLLLGLSSAVSAEEPVAFNTPQETIPWTFQASYGVGFGSDSLSQGSGEVLGPLWQSDSALLFLSAWAGAYEGNEQNYSVGGGFRWLTSDAALMFGVNVFYDHGEVDDYASFDRLGVGFEAFHWLADFRVNAYVADNKRFVDDNFAVLGYGDLFADGYGVFQPVMVSGAQSLSGVEFEFGRELPLSSRMPFSLGLWAGAYAFGGADDIESISGLRARAELKLTDHLALDAAYYNDEEFVGGNTYMGLRASFPLGRKGYEGSSPENVPDIVGNYLRGRLNERVVRTNRVIHTNSVVEREEIENDLIFVNEGDRQRNGVGEGSDDGNGTALRPFETVQDAADFAASQFRKTGRVWTVYTQGLPDREYNEDVKITESTAFTSSAIPIHGYAGKSFGTGDRPVIDGGFQAANLDFVSIQGYQIKDGGRTQLPGARDFSALDSDINKGLGDNIYLEGIREIYVDNNIIEDAEEFGILIIGKDGRNTELTITNNQIVNGEEHGLAIYGVNSWAGTGTISKNLLMGNEGDGAHIELLGSSFSGSITANSASISSSHRCSWILNSSVRDALLYSVA